MSDEDDVDLGELTTEELDEWSQQQDEKREQKAHAEVVAAADQALDHFRETHSDAQQDFIVSSFIETGAILTGEQFGVTEEQAQAVTQGYVQAMQRDVFDRYGITYDEWMEHVGDHDLADFRKDAISGNWQSFHDHAAKAAAMRMELGLPMSGGKNRRRSR